MKKYRISIIIVTFNSQNYIEKCINSIVKSNLRSIKYNICIVDNNSVDNTKNIIKKIQKKNDAIYLIENKKNIGFAKASNQGILKSNNVDYVLLLNPDTLLEKNSLINLIDCSDKHNAGISGGETVNPKGDYSGSYFRFPNLMVGIFDFTNLRKICKNDKWHNYFYYLDTKNSKDAFPVDVVTGGYMLIRISTIKRIGLLSESYFMYLEDVDYCVRAKKAGIRIYHANTSRILHVGGASSNNKDKIRHSSWIQSRKIFFIKHFSIFENIIIQPLFILDDLLILARKTF